MTNAKTTFKADIAKEVTVKAQGQTQAVDATGFHSNTIAAIWQYGVARWFQDNINSSAHAARKELPEGKDLSESDIAALFDKRLAQATSGEFNVRGESTSDPLDQFRIAVLRNMMRANPDGDLKKAHDAIPATDQKERRAFLLAIAEKNADAIDPLAEEAKAEADAKRRAAAAAAGNISL